VSFAFRRFDDVRQDEPRACERCLRLWRMDELLEDHLWLEVVLLQHLRRDLARGDLARLRATLADIQARPALVESLQFGLILARIAQARRHLQHFATECCGATSDDLRARPRAQLAREIAEGERLVNQLLTGGRTGPPAVVVSARWEGIPEEEWQLLLDPLDPDELLGP
jgi:hypothetical protein